MSWNIPDRYQENINLSVLAICAIGLMTGVGLLAGLGYFIYVLSHFEELEDIDFEE